MEKKKKICFWTIYVLITVICVIYLICSKNYKNIFLLAIIAVFILFFNLYFLNQKKQFINSKIQNNIQQLKNNTTATIFAILLFIAIDFLWNDSTKKLFWEFLVSISIVIIWSWFFTYNIGSAILAQINPKKKSIFFGNFIESIFGCASNLTAVMLAITYVFSDDFYISISLEKIVRTVLPILALMLPTNKMYNFIISEYYEYEKEKPVNTIVNEPRVVKKEMSMKSVERKQYRFVNKVKTIEDLDNLEKIIAAQRSKLEKKQYKVFKYFVNNDATIEDLDNLEKIIAAQRSELENNNDVEKHMD